jgi:hypothetical protein
VLAAPYGVEVCATVGDVVLEPRGEDQTAELVERHGLRPGL